MGQTMWKPLVVGKLVPEADGCAWTPIVDYLSPDKLYRLTVKTASAWTPSGASKSCGADGATEALPRKGEKGSMPLGAERAPVGALVARIGGSSADLKSEADKTMVILIGRHCVFRSPKEKVEGALYLGINDEPGHAVALQISGGQLEVSVDESL